MIIKETSHNDIINDGSEIYRPHSSSKRFIWIQGLLKEFGYTIANSNFIYGDNQGSIALANNPEYHARIKHIDIQYHFIRECVQNNKIILTYYPTIDMIADGMTKILAREKHLDLLARMGVGEIAETISPSSIDKQTIENDKSKELETMIGSEA